MTKSELVALISEQADVPKMKAALALDAIVSAIHEVLSKGDRIRIADLGSFSIVTRKERNGVNPRTREPIKIPAAKAPHFTPAKALRDAVKE